MSSFPILLTNKSVHSDSLATYENFAEFGFYGFIPQIYKTLPFVYFSNDKVISLFFFISLLLDLSKRNGTEHFF